MSVLTGDEVGLIKVINKESKSVKLFSPESSPRTVDTRLAVTGLAAFEIEQSKKKSKKTEPDRRIVALRKFGLLEIFNGTTGKQLVVVTTPPDPFFLHAYKIPSADHKVDSYAYKLLVICSRGEIVQFDINKLECSGLARKVKKSIPAENTEDDWRLSLDVSQWEKSVHWTILKSSKKEKTDDTKVKCERVKEEEDGFLPYVDFAFKLTKAEHKLLAAFMFVCEQPTVRRWLLVGGEGINLTIIDLLRLRDETGANRAVIYKAKEKLNSLALKPKIDIRCLGALGEEFFYSIDHKGVFRMYRAYSQQRLPCFGFQATLAGRCPSVARSVKVSADGQQYHSSLSSSIMYYNVVIADTCGGAYLFEIQYEQMNEALCRKKRRLKTLGEVEKHRKLGYKSRLQIRSIKDLGCTINKYNTFQDGQGDGEIRVAVLSAFPEMIGSIEANKRDGRCKYLFVVWVDAYIHFLKSRYQGLPLFTNGRCYSRSI